MTDSNIFSDFPKRSEGADLRLVCNNILCQKLCEKTERLEGLKKAYPHFDADVFALQETDEKWHNEYKLDQTMRELGYELVPVKNSGRWSHILDENDRNATFYRTSTLNLVLCGYERYECTADLVPERPDCAYTWALFEKKSDGKRFIVISTHLISGANGDKRLESARELARFIAYMEQKYRVPVLSCGDYNSGLRSDVYGVLTEGLFSARDTAKVKNNLDYGTTNHIGQKPEKNSGVIDHCFYSKFGVDAKLYEVVVSEHTYNYSDHVPFVFDFSII